MPKALRAIQDPLVPPNTPTIPRYTALRNSQRRASSIARSKDERCAEHGSADLHCRTGSRTAEVDGQTGRAGGGLCKPAADQWPSWQEVVEVTGELVERTFAHAYETGALRQLYVRGKQNVQKRLLPQAAACNLALLIWKVIGVGTPRTMQDAVAGLFFALMRIISSSVPVPGRCARSCLSSCAGCRIRQAVHSARTQWPKKPPLDTGC